MIDFVIPLTVRIVYLLIQSIVYEYLTTIILLKSDDLFHINGRQLPQNETYFWCKEHTTGKTRINIAQSY